MLTSYFPVEPPKNVNLDTISYRLLLFFIMRDFSVDNPIRFNELYRTLNQVKIRSRGFSKPTLDKHLKHLVKRGYVKKKIIAKQHVIYYLNIDNLEIKEARETAKEYKFREEAFKKMGGMTLNEISKLFSNELTLSFLTSTKLMVDYIIESKNRFHHYVALGLEQLYLNNAKINLLAHCHKDKTQATSVSKFLEMMIEEKAKEISNQLGIKDSS